jgi:RNA polymerase sigma-B factor
VVSTAARRRDRRAGEDEVARLLRAYRERGDSAARERIVELHLPLVESIARRHDRSGKNVDDLVQAGSIGLIHAIDRFDPERGAEFAAYAVPTITGEIKRHLRDATVVRVPRRMQELGARARSSQQELAAQLGRDPTTAELADAVGSEHADVAAALESQQARAPASLKDALGADDGELESTADRMDLVGAMTALDDDERRIVRMRFVEGAANDQIASEMRISTRQLSRRLQRALAKLRATLNESEAAPEPAAAPDDLPYEVTLVRDTEGPDAPRWVARVEELPNCVAHGASADEAARRGADAMAAWIADAVARGADLPEPKRRTKQSGRLLLRMPQGLHAELARRADREGTSLNSLIVGVLAGTVGWERGNGAGGQARLDDTGTPVVRRGILVANVVVVALAAVLAIVLLVLAWAHGW